MHIKASTLSISLSLTLTLLFCLGIALPSVSVAQNSDDDFVLLTISGDLIDKSEVLSSDAAPETTITAYYAMLANPLKEQLLELKERLDRRVIDYEVAYTAADTAADTAEINEIIDELSFNWAAIRTLHAQEFTEAAIAALSESYAELYFFIDQAASR